MGAEGVGVEAAGVGVEAADNARGQIVKGWDAKLGDAALTGNKVRRLREESTLSIPEPHAEPRAAKLFPCLIQGISSGLTFKVKAGLLSLNGIHMPTAERYLFLSFGLYLPSGSELWGPAWLV